MIENIQTWFYALSGDEQTFWGITIVASAIFLVQALLTLIGMDVHADMDFDFTDGDTMDAGGAVSLFSIRSLVNFFFGFGWAGVTFVGTMPLWAVVVIAIIIGFCFSYLYIFLRRRLLRLERNGAMNIMECKGKQGSVYLRIPADGKGKVQLSVNGSIHELDAVSNGVEIKTGAAVRVTDVNGNILTVEEV